MDLQELSNRLNRIRNETLNMGNKLNTIKTMGFTKFPDFYEDLMLDAAMQAEQIACQMRHLLFTSGMSRKQKYMEQASVVLHIDVKQVEYGIEIDIPGLLPKRKKGGNIEFLTDPLYYTLNQFVQERRPKRFKNCVVVFQHIYDKKLPQKRIRDYDNVIEPKKILDIINAFLLTDDSGSDIEVFQTTAFAYRECTRILVMEHSKFVNWLNSENPNIEE